LLVRPSPRWTDLKIAKDEITTSGALGGLTGKTPEHTGTRGEIADQSRFLNVQRFQIGGSSRLPSRILADPDAEAHLPVFSHDTRSPGVAWLWLVIRVLRRAGTLAGTLCYRGFRS
jgi:hypothetical protein